jgi:hypothetical protein
MSDKQTTAVVLLVILSLVFYLYTKGSLATVVSAITGSSSKSGVNSTSLAADVASNAQASATGVSYNDPLNTGYFLNAIYGINSGSGVISYSPPSSSSSRGSSSSSPSGLANQAAMLYLSSQ